MEDYERKNALSWDLHRKEKQRDVRGSEKVASEWTEVFNKKTGPKGKQKTALQKQANARGGRNDSSKPQRPAPKLTQEDDNPAEQAWRNRQRATDYIHIPEDLVVLDHSSSTALKDCMHENIARHHGAFILSDDIKGTGFFNFGIWGEKEAVRDAKRALTRWIEETNSAKKSSRSSAFAKLHSLTPALRDRAEKAWRREVRTQRFRQVPPPGSKFKAIGTFHWPAEEYRPDEVFGGSCEALDPIRMEYKCYITFDKEKATFQICACSEANDVPQALVRLRKTIFQIAARQIPGVRQYLLHWPYALTIPTRIYIAPYTHCAPLKAIGDTGKQPRGTSLAENDQRIEGQTDASEKALRTRLLETLKKLHYYRGCLELRIRLGAFLATQRKTPRSADGIYELGEYEDMITLSQFAGEVTQEIGEKDVEHAALSTMQKATSMLQPADNMKECLEEVEPEYSVAFTLADPGGDLRLHIQWRKLDHTGSSLSDFEEVSKRWTRLDRDSESATSILDISLSDLNTGMAWQFDIDASQPVNEARLGDKLRSFASNVKIDAKAASKLDPNQLFVAFRTYTGVNLKHLQQCVHYRYALRSSDGILTDYTLELTRFQDRQYPEIHATAKQASEPVMYEPRWSLNVYRTRWATIFAQNAALAIGSMAVWEDDIDTWFPEDRPSISSDEKKGKKEESKGFEQLMEMLKRIGKIVNDMKGEDESSLTCP